MPAFYPLIAPYYHNQSSGYGNGYKDACYHGLTDYPDTYSQEMGPVIPHHYDRFTKLPPVGPPSNMNANGHAPKHYMGAPPVPPIGVNHYDRSYDQYSGFSSSHGHGPAANTYVNAYQAPKEEAAVGGVSATLDYDMEQMTDFVSETTFGIYELCASRICIADIDILRSVRPSFVLPPSFRKWVLQVLHATRLPSATILLSLAFLAQRVRQQSASGTFDPSEPALYRTLTVSLILGSKFLDDNTFQNKSWSEVSHIHVADLNKAERDWLMAFDHRLHQAPERSDGFKSCEQLWISFKSRRTVNAPSSMLQAVDTNVPAQFRQSQRPSPANIQQPFNKPTAIDTTFNDAQFRSQAFPAYDPWHSHSASPASAQTSGPHTPEYYGGHAVWGNSPAYGRQDWTFFPVDSCSTSQTPYPKYGNYPFCGYAQGPYMHGPTYGNCHGAACQCGTCRASHFTPQYGPMVGG